jgi:pilus assembly protein Flp/PilA
MDMHTPHPINAAVRSASRWAADERGVTAIEYGLLAALIVVTIIGAISATGTSMTAMYTFWSVAVLGAL